MSDWFLQRGQDWLGPYQFEQLRDFAASGRITPSDILWQSESRQWIRANEVRGLFPQRVRPPVGPAYPAQRKKRGGCVCLTGLAGIVAVLLVCVASIGVALFLLANRPSSNLAFDSAISLVVESVDSNGGVVLVERPGDPMDGFKIDVPPGAFPQETKFDVRYHPITTHRLGPYFNPVTPLIHIKNGGQYSQEPMVVTIPVPNDPDRFTMAFYYDRKSGKLEGLPLIDAGDGYIKVLARHFSDVVASSIRINELEGKMDIDTGFRPGYDDWQFTNYGTWAEPRGHCAGQAISAMWYFYERRFAGERPLYGRYDNNDRGYGTIDFWQDDSWGIRLAAAVQKDLNWENVTRKTLLQFRGYQDSTTFMAFAYAMLITEMPQYVGIASSTSPGGHAIIAYRLEQDKLYVADPNYPGVERVIRYANNHFQPYNSGDNADAIAQGNQVAYDKIGYFAVTAMVDWDQVGQRWSQLEGGRSADEYFNNYQIGYWKAGTERYTWTPLVDGLSLSKEDTGVGTDIGKIQIALISNESDIRVSSYRGVRLWSTKYAGGSAFSNYAIPRITLEEGINDLGFLIEEEVGGRWKYVDFQRFIVIYNEVDLTGNWEGHLIIEEADLFIKKIEDIFVFFFDPLLKDVFDYEGDTRQLFRDSLDPVGIGVPFDFVIQIEAVPDEENLYIIYSSSVDEYGTLVEDRYLAKFEDGMLKFHAGQLKSSGFAFEGWLIDDDTLSGTFIIKEWFGNLGSGTWEVQRVE
jgi:hypothetical protein